MGETTAYCETHGLQKKELKDEAEYVEKIEDSRQNYVLIKISGQNLRIRI